MASIGVWADGVVSAIVGIASSSEVILTSARRSARRIHDILDHLDCVQVALIVGAFPRHDLQRPLTRWPHSAKSQSIPV